MPVTLGQNGPNYAKSLPESQLQVRTGHPPEDFSDIADAEQFNAILAAEIIKALGRERLTVRAAHARTGIAAADFSRIRNADLGRFTVDRLISVLNRLGSRVEVKVRVHRVA